VLVDARRPPSFDSILGAVSAVAPWVVEKVSFCEADLFVDGGSVGASQGAGT